MPAKALDRDKKRARIRFDMEPAERIRLSDLSKPPNILSLLRIVLLYPFVWLSVRYVQEPDNELILSATLAVVVLAMFTDFLDGYLARKMGWKTPLGQYLDPVSDRIVTIGGLVILHIYYHFPLWILLFYIFRDAMGVLGGAVLYLRFRLLGKPNDWGKWGVGLVGLVVIWYLLIPYLSTRLPEGHILLQPVYLVYLLLVILIMGIISYARTYLPLFFAKKGHENINSP